MIRFANVTTVLSGAGKTKILMTISVVTMVLNAIFNVIGFKVMGLVGPAIVTLILTAGMTIVLLHFGAEEIKTKVCDLFDFKEVGVVGIQIIMMGAIAYTVSSFLSSSGIPVIIDLLLSYGLYIIVLGLLNSKRILSCYRELNQYK